MQRNGYHMLCRISTMILMWGVFILWAHPALSEPYLAVRGGYKCSQCHTNITGGGKRNGFGSIYTQTTLPYKIISASSLQNILSPTGASSGDPNYGTFIANTLADFLSFGGELRVENRTRFSEGPLETTNSLDVTEANLYIEARLLRDFLSFYVDEQLGPSAASSREVFGLIRAPAGGISISKAVSSCCPTAGGCRTTAPLFAIAPALITPIRTLGLNSGSNPALCRSVWRSPTGLGAVRITTASNNSPCGERRCFGIGESAGRLPITTRTRRGG